MSAPSLLWPPEWNAGHVEQCQASLERLPNASPDAVERALADFRRELSRVHHGNEFLNIDLADAMLSGLHAAWAQHAAMPSRHQHWLCLATAYLVDPADAVNDFTKLDGLDDDAFIVATALRALGFPEYAQRIEGAVT